MSADELRGVAVRKNFKGYGWFNGKVTEVIDGTKLLVTWTDGTTEKMTCDAVRKHAKTAAEPAGGSGDDASGASDNNPKAAKRQKTAVNYNEADDEDDEEEEEEAEAEDEDDEDDDEEEEDDDDDDDDDDDEETDVTKMTVPQLKAECSERGLPVGGKKEELVERLGGGGASASGTPKKKAAGGKAKAVVVDSTQRIDKGVAIKLKGDGGLSGTVEGFDPSDGQYHIHFDKEKGKKKDPPLKIWIAFEMLIKT